MGIDVYGFTKDNTTPLATLLTDPIYNACGDCEAFILIILFYNFKYCSTEQRRISYNMKDGQTRWEIFTRIF